MFFESLQVLEHYLMKLIVLHIYLLTIVTSVNYCEFSDTKSAVIHGHVSEKGTGLPVNDVIVRWQGTSHSVITGVDGNFQITVHPGSRNLVFSRPGWVERKIRVRGRDQLDIKMKRKKRTSVPPQPEEDLPPDTLGIA